jgi:hypothetical protein
MEKRIIVITARNMTTINTLTAVSKKPPSVRMDPSRAITRRISATMPPIALRRSAIIRALSN